MNLRRHFFACIALLLTAGTAAAQAQGGDWVSYRDAYRKMVVFEKYGKAKNLIQHQLQVMPRDKSASLEGLQLSLVGSATRLDLPLDPTGRAVFPLQKAAYDDNAVLTLNRRAGLYQFQPRVSILVQSDGLYDAAGLRAACEQVLAYETYLNRSLSGKRCVGVRFAFAKGQADPGVRLRKGDSALPAIDGAAFAGDLVDGFQVVDYRFGDATAQIVTRSVPLAISALYE